MVCVLCVVCIYELVCKWCVYMNGVCCVCVWVDGVCVCVWMLYMCLWMGCVCVHVQKSSPGVTGSHEPADRYWELISGPGRAAVLIAESSLHPHSWSIWRILVVCRRKLKTVRRSLLCGSFKPSHSPSLTHKYLTRREKQGTCTFQHCTEYCFLALPRSKLFICVLELKLREDYRFLQNGPSFCHWDGRFIWGKLLKVFAFYTCTVSGIPKIKDNFWDLKFALPCCFTEGK